jgi:hypothetical protein
MTTIPLEFRAEAKLSQCDKAKSLTSNVLIKSRPIDAWGQSKIGGTLKSIPTILVEAH